MVAAIGSKATSPLTMGEQTSQSKGVLSHTISVDVVDIVDKDQQLQTNITRLRPLWPQIQPSRRPP